MTTEYNKIHALAQARLKVMDIFDKDILHFWPLSGGEEFQQDLVRQRGLFAQDGAALQAAGVIDYAINMDELGFAADVSDSEGDTTLTETGKTITVPNVRTAVQAGYWKGMKWKIFSHAASRQARLYIAPSGLTPDKVLTRYVYKSPQRSLPTNDYYTFNEIFDAPILASDGVYEAFIIASASFQGVEVDQPGYDLWFYSGDQWNDSGGDAPVEFVGGDAKTWAAENELAVGLWLETALFDGTVFDFATNLAAHRFRLYMEGGVAKGYVYNGAAGYTLTGISLHPGYNFLLMAYKRNTANGLVLYENGVSKDTETPSDNAVLGETLAVGVGATVKTDGTPSARMYDSKVCDVFVAKKVPTDQQVWDIFKAYLVAAPLMQTRSA